MKLYETMMETCVMVDKITSPDGYGGIMPVWRDGASFEAAVVLNTSMEARVGEKQGVTALYTVTTSKGINLQYHDVFRRVRDGKVFRVTSDGDDKHSPHVGTLDMRQVSAEEWVLTQ